jgi:hypothetical protein
VYGLTEQPVRHDIEARMNGLVVLSVEIDPALAAPFLNLI